MPTLAYSDGCIPSKKRVNLLFGYLTTNEMYSRNVVF